MKIAVVYNRDSKSVINLFGMPNREKIGLMTIKRLVDALKKGGHQVVSMEADKDLVDRLEDFMPQVLQGERPGMVFNVSYGLQGQARYTHVPSILEMVGIPYVASGPLGHSLALDKVVTKMVLRQRNIPTPDFAVLDTPQAELPPDLSYPMIVKPRNEAVSFGLAVVQDEEDLRRAAGIIFNEFRQPVLAEQYIEGREINVGLLGNDPVEAFAPVLLDFGEGPQIYTYEDKTGSSGREIRPVCPAPIGDELTDEAKDIAIRTFNALGLYDCARIDMRLDKDDRLFVLEANSLPSLGEHGRIWWLKYSTPFAAVEAPRIHCSLDGKVSLEAARIRNDVPGVLRKHGFEVVPREPYSFYMGCVQMVVRDHRSGELIGIADPRRDGAAAGPAS